MIIEVTQPNKPRTTGPAKDPRKDMRTTVSFAAVVWDMLWDNMGAGGFNNNVSAYLADRIRRHNEELRQSSESTLNETPVPYLNSTPHAEAQIAEAVRKEVEKLQARKTKSK